MLRFLARWVVPHGVDHYSLRMAILGAHMSIAGGYYKSVDAAHRAGCDCVQLFTKNNNQWRAKPIADDEVERFRRALSDLKIKHPISHDSYLINLASPDDELWKKSIDAFVVEIQRADQLGIPYVVTHPGSFTTSTESRGTKRIVKALNEVHKQTRGAQAKCLLETVAGQGTNLGWKFEQLAAMIEGVRDPDRLGVCVDTCHIFAAGYPMDTEKNYKATMRSLNATIGVQQVKAFHLNDSLKEFGSRVDRHAAIGRGKMGLEPFRFLLNDRRFRKVPMYMETPKGEEKGVDLDVINLRTLRGLIKK
ncbi:deoxyribonuclease IV [Bythopirellula polymerisocia]|nr:deoxyribonuclease IV [Bythopirellula polymerisocia]